MKTGLVLEGGAMRGVFTAGVLDVLMEHGIFFDGLIGVSAGAAFGCNFKSRQIGRVLRYNLRFCRYWRYASWRSLFLTGDLFGAEFCYHPLPEKLDVFDAAEFARNPVEFHLVCTDIATGAPVYRRCDVADHAAMEWIRASSSMPLVSRPVEIEGKKYLDGALSDSIPLEYFEKQGFGRNLVILTQPAGYVKRRSKLEPLVSFLCRRYPKVVEGVRLRAERYNRQLDFVRDAENSGRAFVIRPEAPLPIHRVSHAPDAIRRVHALGVEAAEKNLEAIQTFLREAKNT